MAPIGPFRTTAAATVRLPARAAAQLRRQGYATAKGPVFHTAIVAGTMAAKRTHELIPFCHPLRIEHCSVDLGMDDDGRIYAVMVPDVCGNVSVLGQRYVREALPSTGAASAAEPVTRRFPTSSSHGRSLRWTGPGSTTSF